MWFISDCINIQLQTHSSDTHRSANTYKTTQRHRGHSQCCSNLIHSSTCDHCLPHAFHVHITPLIFYFWLMPPMGALCHPCLLQCLLPPHMSDGWQPCEWQSWHPAGSGALMSAAASGCWGLATGRHTESYWQLAGLGHGPQYVEPALVCTFP